MTKMMYCLFVLFAIQGFLHATADAERVSRTASPRFSGTVGSKGDYPYQILLLNEGEPECQGALVSSEYILTSALCAYYWQFDENPSIKYSAKAGLHDLSLSPSSSEQSRNIGEVIPHPDGDFLRVKSDLFLLKVTEPFTFDELRYVQAAQLPTKRTSRGCVVTGFNFTGPGGIVESERTKLPRKQCRRFLRDLGALNIYDPKKMCTVGMTDSCTENVNGAPMICRDTLVGILSYVYPTRCSSGFMVFIEIYKYLDWIRTYIPE